MEAKGKSFVQSSFGTKQRGFPSFIEMTVGLSLLVFLQCFTVCVRLHGAVGAAKLNEIMKGRLLASLCPNTTESCTI